MQWLGNNRFIKSKVIRSRRSVKGIFKFFVFQPPPPRIHSAPPPVRGEIMGLCVKNMALLPVRGGGPVSTGPEGLLEHSC